MINLEKLNFHHLFYFWRVAKVGHLTKVAQELNTSQSSVSAQIRHLEQSVGTDLFSRENRKLILTEAGHLVASYADNIFGLSQEMLGRLQGHSSGITRLRVGSVATLSRNYLENWIKPLLNEPTILLTLESGLKEDLLSRLMKHQLDVVLTNESLPTDPDMPFHCHFLNSKPIFLVGPSGVWRNKTLRVPEDLHGVHVALPGPRNNLRSQFDALCAIAKVQPNLRAEVDDMAMLRLIARDSGWLTVVPEVVVQDELKSGVLVKVGQSDALQERFYAITSHQCHCADLIKTLIEKSIEPLL